MTNPTPLAKPPAATAAPSLSWLQLHDQASLPFRAYNESAAYDLSACLWSLNGRPNTLILPPNHTRKISTGIALRPPPGHLVLICSRSGLALESVFVANGPGVVDPTYTGEIGVLLFNGGVRSFHVKHGDRIAQALVVPFAALPLLKVDKLPDTERGDKGFGSSGMGGMKDVAST